MASAFERWIGHLELRLHVAKKPSQKLSLKVALHHLLSIKENITGNKYDDGRWIIFLSDIKYDQKSDFFILLFLGVDKHSGDRCYADIRTLDLREIQKLETEGSAVSAHLCISGTPNSQTQLYCAGLEEVEGLSRTRIIGFLKNIIRTNCVFHPKSSDDKADSLIAILSGDVVNDVSISEQMQSARLLAVDIVNNNKKSNIDPDLGYYEKSRSIQFRPTSSTRGIAGVQLLRRIIDAIDPNDYPEVRIKIEDDHGAQRTAKAACKDALTSAFQKHSLIDNITPALPEATKNIIDYFAQLMINVIK